MKYLYVFLAFVSKALRYSERKVRLQKAIAKGMKVGQGTKFVGDVFFGTEPFLIEIGEECLVTDGVKFISHDGGVGTIFIKDGKKLGDVYARNVLVGRIKVGNNVFIGTNSILLYGACVSDNTLIAAGSVVKGSYPPNVVIAGAPAKVISSLADYKKKNMDAIFKLNVVSEEERSRSIRSHIELKERQEDS